MKYKLVKHENWKDKYLRSIAELDNFRKRTIEEKAQITTNSKIEIMEQILPILDSVQSALKMNAEGIAPIAQQIADIFAKLGVTEIEAVGKEFNPNLHNAVMHEKDENQDTNIIVEEFAKGYICGDKVIRHSMVKVVN